MAVGVAALRQRAELNGLAAVAHARLGQHEPAEHRTTTPDPAPPPTWCATGPTTSPNSPWSECQHHLDGGCADSEQALKLTGPAAASVRIRTLLGTFRRRVAAAAPYEPTAAERLQHTHRLLRET